MGLRLVICFGSLSCLGMRVTRPIFCLGGKELFLRQLLMAEVTRSPAVKGWGDASYAWGFIIRHDFYKVGYLSLCGWVFKGLVLCFSDFVKLYVSHELL